MLPRRTTEIVFDDGFNTDLIRDAEFMEAIGYLSLAFLNYRCVIFVGGVGGGSRPEHEITATYYDGDTHKYTIGAIRRIGEKEYEFHS